MRALEDLRDQLGDPHSKRCTHKSHGCLSIDGLPCADSKVICGLGLPV